MVNDTVGTMMNCGYQDQSCEIGMIIGKQMLLWHPDYVILGSVSCIGYAQILFKGQITIWLRQKMCL